MHRIWRDDRNQMSIDLVKAEICINLNFSIVCVEFISYVKTNEKLLKSVKSIAKYIFLCKIYKFHVKFNFSMDCVILII